MWGRVGRRSARGVAVGDGVDGVDGSGRERWFVPGAVGELGPGCFPWPVDSQVQNESTCGLGEPGRDVDELGPEGDGGRFGVER